MMALLYLMVVLPQIDGKYTLDLHFTLLFIPVPFFMLISEADPENLDRGGPNRLGALSRIAPASQKGASRGYILVGLRALYQSGHLPTTGGAMAPLAPPVYPPLLYCNPSFWYASSTQCINSLYCRSTPYTAVGLQCTLHGSVRTVQFGLGDKGNDI